LRGYSLIPEKEALYMVGTSNKSVPVAWPLIYGISGYPNVFGDMYNINDNYVLGGELPTNPK
jgi:hypothetical protein